MPGMDLEIIKLLTETGNPFINLLALGGLAGIIYLITSILKSKEKVNTHDIEINHMKETITDLKNKINLLENEHYSRKGGKR